MLTARMNVTEIILIGLALAVDATVYSFSYGLILPCRRAMSAFWLALTTGVYQAGMPLAGYFGGCEVRAYVEQWKSPLVLAVFCVLGLCIIRGAFRDGEEKEGCCSEPMGFLALMVVGIATAIDAFAVGGAMSIGEIAGISGCTGELFAAVGIIGLITFVCSLAAFHSARLLHRLPTKVLEVSSGLLLIAIGVYNVI